MYTRIASFRWVPLSPPLCTSDVLLWLGMAYFRTVTTVIQAGGPCKGTCMLYRTLDSMTHRTFLDVQHHNCLGRQRLAGRSMPMGCRSAAVELWSKPPLIMSLLDSAPQELSTQLQQSPQPKNRAHRPAWPATEAFLATSGSHVDCLPQTEAPLRSVSLRRRSVCLRRCIVRRKSQPLQGMAGPAL